MRILYNDSDIAVIVKPYGISSQKAEGKNIPDLLAQRLEVEVFPVHRLDRTTGGVMVYALNSRSAAHLSKQITENRFKKEYLAVVQGELEENNGIMTDLLYYDRKKNKAYVVKKERKGVKKAVLHYEVLKVFQQNNTTYSLLKIALETGRTHQIRVQFAYRGFSLCGDRRYGSKENFKNISLWAHTLSFNHPKSKKQLTFTAEPNEDFFTFDKN